MIILLRLFLFTLASYQLLSDVYPDRIIIKFRADSEQFHLWNAYGRTGEIRALSDIIGLHSSRPLINDNIIYALSNDKTNKNDNTLSATKPSIPLARIVVVQYSSDINPDVLSRKLSSLPWVEYAEPMPFHRIFDFPNDPKTNGQYYLDSVYIYEAWDLIDTTESIVVGIVDTGIDYEHEDILANMFINPGEDGNDSSGADRRTNKIDDDGNGFIDDWKGWDFSSSDSSGQDNDPAPGHKHGTHVGGTVGAVTNNAIGIASVGRFVKLMAVKASGDNPLSTSVENGYEGILYAAIAGAKVINCSWGSNSRAESEEEVIRKAGELGALVVAAAGNNNNYETFYPAGYKGVVSVAALNSINQKASFSNYSESVDVSAPGDDILATVPNQSYEFMSGTSMASPVVSGVAALARIANPGFSPMQIHELLRMSCDDIYGINPFYQGMLGKGKINAVKAVSSKNVRSVVLNSSSIIGEKDDGVIDRGETVSISTSYHNILSAVNNVVVNVSLENFPEVVITNDKLDIGDMGSNDITSAYENISFRIPEDIGYNQEIRVTLSIEDSLGLLNTEVITFYANPSYRNFDRNNIATTINSFGNIGYNDYPSNVQGIGFKYKNADNMLFEGALLASTGYGKVSNVARGLLQLEPDRNFITSQFLRLNYSGEYADLEGFSQYFDNNDTNRAGVEIIQRTFQSSKPENSDFIILSYDIRNQSMNFFDSLYVGLFFDWDIGPSGANNQADFDSDYQFGYVSNVNNDTLPMAGVALIGESRLNYYAIDNGGSADEGSINIYNGFTPREKWMALSSKLKRKKSSVTDASMVVSAGPLMLFAGDTTRVNFAIFSGANLNDLRNASENARTFVSKIGIDKSGYRRLPLENSLSALFPNPVTDDVVSIEYTIVKKSDVRIELYDLMGRLNRVLTDIKDISLGNHELSFTTKELSGGIYYLLLKTSSNTQFAAFSIIN